MTSLLIAKCDLPKLLSVLLFIQGVTFLILFTNFYIQSYIINKEAVSNKAAAAAAVDVPDNANKTKSN